MLCVCLILISDSLVFKNHFTNVKFFLLVCILYLLAVENLFRNMR